MMVKHVMAIHPLQTPSCMSIVGAKDSHTVHKGIDICVDTQHIVHWLVLPLQSITIT